MKRLIVISLIVVLFSAGYISNSYALGGFGSILRNFLRGSKNIADDIGKNLTKPADEIKTLGSKSPEEIAGVKNVEQSGHTISSIAKKEQLLSTVGKERHSADFLAVKKNDRGSFTRLRNIDDLQLDNIVEWVLESKGESSSNPYSFYKYIIINWIGKVYINSDYYNKPKLEEKMLLVCNAGKDIFYFALFMEQEPKRAFLINHISNENDNILPNQELVVLEDAYEEKLMATMPEQSNKYPGHYFFILEENQGFIYNKSKGNTSPESIKFQSIFIQPEENMCFKSSETGLY